MCEKAIESVPHVFSRCSVLAQSKYKTRHDPSLKVLFFDLLCDMGLIESAPSCCSPDTQKPEYKNERASAFWDVPVYAEKMEVRANRIDAIVVDKQKKKVLLLEMSCPWMVNRKQKETRKARSTHRSDRRSVCSIHTIRLHSTTSSSMYSGAYKERH